MLTVRDLLYISKYLLKIRNTPSIEHFTNLKVNENVYLKYNKDILSLITHLGDTIICVREEDMDESLLHNDHDSDECSSYQVIIRDDKFFLSSQVSNLIPAFHIDKFNENDEIYPLPNNEKELSDYSLMLDKKDMLIVNLHYALKNNIPPNLYLMYNYKVLDKLVDVGAITKALEGLKWN